MLMTILTDIHLHNLSYTPLVALQYLISQLLNRAEEFESLVKISIITLQEYISNHLPLSKDRIVKLMLQHIDASDHAARLLEVAMHSLAQAMYELDVYIGQEVKPLSQMRSANKKHGNVADIEILLDGEVVEAWDAKYGKTYLRDEIEELGDKLQTNTHVEIAGFVTSSQPERISELQPRLNELQAIYGTRIHIFQFSDWVSTQFSRAYDEMDVNEADLSKSWITAYLESIAQLRREIAPIDEPCYRWLDSLRLLLT